MKNERKILYETSAKEIATLLEKCSDERIHTTLACIRHVLPMRTDIEDVYAEHNLSVIDFQELLQLKEPLRDFNLILQSLDSLVEKYAENAWAYILRARALWGIEYYAAALQDIEKAQNLLPNMLLLERMRAETLFFLERYYPALNLISSLIDAFPNNGRNYIVRYLIWCGLANRSDTLPHERTIYLNAAIADLEKASSVTPKQAAKIQLLVNRLKEIR